MQLVIGIGGNQGDVEASFVTATAALAAHHRVLAWSRLYRSSPVGPQQPDFLNAAVLLATVDHPMAILALCQKLEQASGRDRTREQRWGPRPLDLDLLISDSLVIESPALMLPHPRLHERRFALLPTVELVPDWVHPRLRRPLADLAAVLDPHVQSCVPIGAFPT